MAELLEEIGSAEVGVGIQSNPQAQGGGNNRLITRRYECPAAEAVTHLRPIIGARSIAWTNLLTYSEQMDNAAWTLTNVTVAADSVKNPWDGSRSVDRIVETVTNGEHKGKQAATVVAGVLTGTIFAKAGERTFVELYLHNATDGELGNTVFNLETGEVSSGTGEILPAGNFPVVPGEAAPSDALMFYRLKIKATPTVANSALFFRIRSAAGTSSYAGDTTKGLYLWGAQIVARDGIGPYVKTTSATATTYTSIVDPKFTSAFLVGQDIAPKDRVKAIVTRLFAEIPTTWDDYTTRDYLFPAFTGVNAAGLDGLPASRANPEYKEADVRVSHVYGYGSAAAITKPSIFAPVDSTNARTNALTATTTPSAEEYEYYIAAQQELVLTTPARRWRGDIFYRAISRVLAL